MYFFKNLFSKSKPKQDESNQSLPKQKDTVSTSPKQKDIETTSFNQNNTFTDSRDGKTYKTIKIGNQVWMAENLCYQPQSGNYWAYENKQSNVAEYGYLYDWETAKKVCPSGWHLPSEEEFETLLSNFGDKGNAFHSLKEGGSSGFSALFGGWRDGDGDFDNVGGNGNWWSSSEHDASGAWHLHMYSSVQDAYMNGSYKAYGFSVRCLQD